MIYRMLAIPFTVVLSAGMAITMSSSAARATAPAPRATPVALLELAFYGKRANSLEPGDSLLAGEATRTVRRYLAADTALSLADSAAVATAERSPEALEAANGKPCNVIVACARAVGQKLGVPWVVMGKVSKTSNLIWIFSGQLIDVASGQLVMDDEYELKGIATDMVPKGALVFARRVAKRIAQGTTASAGAPGAAGARPERP